MRLRTLGGLTLRDTASEAMGPTTLARPKPLLLLAYLALEGPRDRRHLAALFWPDAAAPLNSLRVALSQLRAAAPGVLEDAAGGLTARLACDAVEFLAALDGGSVDAAAVLYQGPFLAGFDLPGMHAELEEWVYRTREVLAGRLQHALVGRAEADAADGAFDAAARRAEAALGLAEPLEPALLERLHRLLVAGQHHAARAVREAASEYGLALQLTPQEARRQLLHDRGGWAVPHNLRPRTDTFVGRDPELLELARLLTPGPPRLVTITGPGGTGKSRLALEAALAALREQRYHDGVFLVSLESLRDPRHLPAALAAGLRLDAGADQAADTLTAALAGKRLLLVLDDFEHLRAEHHGAGAGDGGEGRESAEGRDGAASASGAGGRHGAAPAGGTEGCDGAEGRGGPAAAHAAPAGGAERWLVGLLQACPGLELLVTSRERLHVTGEQVFVLEGLPLPPAALALEDAGYQDAVRLFLQHAHHADLNFRLSPGTLAAVVALCRLTHGSPLAIELAAALVRVLPVAELARELAHSLDLLGGGRRDAHDRHRSLRATFEHSWRLLEGAEQRVLRQLAVFAGGFDREAAAAVAGATIPLLASLVDKSLLSATAAGRFELQPLLHRFILEKAAAHPDERAAARSQHAAHFAALAEEAERQLKGPQQAPWLDRLEAEHDNLRAVLDAGAEGRERGLALATAGALWQFWQQRGHLREGRERYAALLAASSGLEAGPELAKAHAGAGVLAFHQGDYAAARSHHAAALALRRTLDLPLAAARSRYNLGGVAAAQGDYGTARACFEESLAVFRRLGDAWTVATALTNLGTLASRLGDAAAARRHHEESLALRRALGDDHGVAEALANLASVRQAEGDADGARAAAREALALHGALGDPLAIAACLEACAALSAEAGDPEGAARLWGAAEAAREALAAPRHEDERPNHQAAVAAARRQLGDARFAAAWRHGRSLDLDRARALAAGESGVPGVPGD